MRQKLHKALGFVRVAMLGVLRRLLIVPNHRLGSVAARRYHAHHFRATPSKISRRMMTTPAPQVNPRFDIPQTLLATITDNH